MTQTITVRRSFGRRSIGAAGDQAKFAAFFLQSLHNTHNKRDLRYIHEKEILILYRWGSTMLEYLKQVAGRMLASAMATGGQIEGKGGRDHAVLRMQANGLGTLQWSAGPAKPAVPGEVRLTPGVLMSALGGRASKPADLIAGSGD